MSEENTKFRSIFYSNAIPFLTFECFRFFSFNSQTISYDFHLRCVHLGISVCWHYYLYLFVTDLNMHDSLVQNFSLLLFLHLALTYYSIGHKATITIVFFEHAMLLQIEMVSIFFSHLVRPFVCLFVWLVFHFMVHWWHFLFFSCPLSMTV